MAARHGGAGGKKKQVPAVLRAKATPKRPARPAPAKAMAGSTMQQVERASTLATRMPLVHYPAVTRLATWSAWTDGLASRAARQEPIGPGDFEQLRGAHVFFYAGPCCYYRHGCVGDAALYFDPSAEEGQAGGASPFDSGALEDPTPKLQPWAQATPGERWKFFQEHAMPIDDWRERFEQWLAASYDEPDRYLETSPNRWEAGQPDRLTPPEILEHNGTRGYAEHGPDCADRRAWTWEIRIADRLPFARVRALHVPARQLRKAYDATTRMRWTSGFVPEVMTLRRGVEPTPDTLYADSGRVLRELIGR